MNLTYDPGFKIVFGRRFLIEMQMWSQHYFHKRAVYYSSLSVQDQARVEKKSQKERPAGVEGTELEELYDEAHYTAGVCR